MAERMPEITKACPECGSRLVIRTNHTTLEEFIGCARYPACRYTEKLPESLRMRRIGHPTLF